MEKTAIVLGASGLVGNEVLNLLLSNDDYASVKVFVRKSLQIVHPKLREHIIDFNSVASYTEIIKGDCVFCCLGTTIKTAGSQKAFIKVDHDLPVEFAKIVKQNGCEKFLLISSLGANKTSSNFYLKVKGQVETDIDSIRFKRLLIFHPSMLLGNRKEKRTGENLGKFLMKLFSFIFIGKLKKYKAIEASAVARAMVRSSKSEMKGTQILESDEIQSIGN